MVMRLRLWNVDDRQRQRLSDWQHNIMRLRQAEIAHRSKHDTRAKKNRNI
jgi:hypothetical protein